MIANAECLVRLRQDELLREVAEAHLVRMLRTERKKARSEDQQAAIEERELELMPFA